ncbi:MAG: hydrogenase maturation nickel metallochaperone HypA [Nanoarchaeota archaeon]|nr:hydrogenase maturation nickel metallochaperone HypA [Nanoarchaeota archaeon]
MHEINIADRVLREARKAGATHFLRVEIGELCEVTKEELEEGLHKVMAPVVVESLRDFGGTVLQSSAFVEELEDQKWECAVDFVESRVRCEKCGFEGRAKISDRGHGYCLWECLRCGKSGKDVEVLAGGEIRVVEVE